ncbi:Multicopper oxidase mco [Phytophthora cinnamomi]|uniref:Multicopper oxidase mco n=1 Tax=Phytophthora cinnamomi TaxID=4785 RepID=UPI003559C201|nr:Multicopper oxidase mco [Phytophthora cinnamomi]
MRLSACLCAVVLSAALAVVTAENDYQPLRQPTVYESECAKQWTKLNSDSSADDRSTARIRASELRINLSVQLTRFTSDYADFNTRSFNGEVPAPTIKVCPGDTLVVTLTNGLEAGRGNNTNLHLHGMHLPPVGDADNVMPNVEPGGQRRYTYEIRQDHPAGTFWYHSHAPGNENAHLNGMMAGTLIVVDRPADLSAELAAMDDLVLMLQAICVENCVNVFDNLEDALENKFDPARRLSQHMDTPDEADLVWPTDLEVVEDEADAPLNDTSLPTVFVNGQYLPTLKLAVGEYKRLRLVNAIANNVAELVTTHGSGCTMDVLAMDGIYFDTPVAKKVIVIPPGGRADVAVMCAEIGKFYLETDCASSRNKLLGLENQHRVPSQRVVKLKVTKEAEDDDSGDGKSAEAKRLPFRLPKRPAYMEDTIGGDNSPPFIEEGNTYGFEFSVWMDKGIVYGVNHEKFDPTHINYSMPVNEMQQWELSVKDYRKPSLWSCDLDAGSSNGDRRLTKSSSCSTMNHPFHMHSTHFQVSGMDDDTDPDGVMFEVGEWRDTLPLFSGGVQIRFTPRDYMMGHIFAHCHIASHVDGGMAQLVRVYNPEEDNGDDNEFGAGSTADEEEGSDGSSDTDEDEDDEDDSGSDENGSDEAEEEGDEEEGEEEGKP